MASEQLGLSARTRSVRSSNGGCNSGAGGAADRARVPKLTHPRGLVDEMASMGMMDTDERDLGDGVEDGERSIGAEETRSGPRG